MKFLLTTIIFLLPAFVSADSVEIINNVSTSASTGGNSASSGQVIEGKAKSSVKVYTEVNGEVVEDFEKELEGKGEINYQAEKKIDGGKVETKVEINAATSDSDRSEMLLDASQDYATSSLEKEVSKSPFDIGEFGQKVKEIFKYVFSFFKF